ncbi:MAG: hypothetical protein M1830_001329 [Pleopsidium flavum]|nr:MAG: hypothetical protein M1830_001329 [Pleopsidium flavum]
MAGCLGVVLARSEDQVELQLQYYLNVRSHFKDFWERLQDQLARLEGGARDDLLLKCSTLLSFDYEAAVRLKAWDDLVRIIEDCAICADPDVYGTLADITLCSEAPTPIMLSTLQKIVNVTWRLEGNSVTKLSRWIRCLFQIALTSDINIAEHLLDQIVNVAKDTKVKPDPYPREELEWLATTTFNRAVDYYCASDDGACRRWAEKALSIASLNEDGGALHNTLQSKYSGLTWEN